MTRTCLLVVGAHRSGTSAVTRVLSLMGATLPRQLLAPNASNEVGHWEPAELVALNDRMLAAAGSRWDDLRTIDAAQLEPFRDEVGAVIAHEFGDAGTFVLKDPRICRLVPVYEAALAAMKVDVVFVVVLRNPLAVARSLAKRDGATIGTAGLLWLRNMLDAERATRGKRRFILQYEELLANWQRATHRLREELGLDGDAEAVEAFLSSALQHEAPGMGELEAEARLGASVADAYRALRQLAHSDPAPQPFGDLDRIGREFDAALREFALPSYAEECGLANEVAVVRGWLRKAQAEIANGDVHRRALEVRVAALESSTSWRATAGLRALKSMITRGSGA